MEYQIEISDDSKEDLKRLRAVDRGKVGDAVKVHLRHEPTKESRTSIKRLRGMDRPQYRLRVENLRVYYDVLPEGVVDIIAVVPKAESAAWLAQKGTASASGGEIAEED